MAPSIGHISPEAAAGGPIALVEDGDEIFIDIAARRLELKVSPEELERRRAVWKPLVKPRGPALAKSPPTSALRTAAPLSSWRIAPVSEWVFVETRTPPESLGSGGVSFPFQIPTYARRIRSPKAPPRPTIPVLVWSHG